MLTRRAFAACALCAAAGFAATNADAEGPPAFRRTVLKQTDGPAPGYVTLEVRVELDPDAAIPRHTHPGIESGYVVEGATALEIDGIGTLSLKPGDAYQVPTGVPHQGRNGAGKTTIAATFVVEKGKPLASPA